MKLDELEEQVNKDLDINPDEIGDFSLKVPLLHNKYMKHLNKFVMKAKKAQQDLDAKYVERYKFYKTEHKILLGTKGEIDAHIHGDKDYIEIRRRLDYNNQVVKYLQEVIKNINQITFHIKNKIEFLKFINGVV